MQVVHDKSVRIFVKVPKTGTLFIGIIFLLFVWLLFFASQLGVVCHYIKKRTLGVWLHLRRAFM